MEKFEKNDKRTHYCGDLRLSDAGKTVTVAGWVQRQRDLGALIFIDLRDREGIVQLAFDDKTDKDEKFSKKISSAFALPFAARVRRAALVAMRDWWLIIIRT